MSNDRDPSESPAPTTSALPDTSTSTPSKTFRASPSPDVAITSSSSSSPSLLKSTKVESDANQPSFDSPITGSQDGDMERNDVGEGSSSFKLPSSSTITAAAAGDGTAGARRGQEEIVVAVPLPETLMPETNEEWWDLKMSWSGKLFEIKVASNDMVYDFREQIHRLTQVPPVRQKIIGLSKGKLGTETDSRRFGSLGVKKDCKFTLIGTPESDTFKDPAGLKAALEDDFDVSYGEFKAGTYTAPAADPRNKRMIESIIQRVPITVMNEPRPGKKLLVLDLDYTMVDSKPLLAGSLPPEECARPGLHDFLERVYPYYDIVIWSQTHWRWLESKLAELGVIGGDKSYKISFVSDRSTMFPVFTLRDGQPFKHEVKPLAYFWANYPQWSAKNTIHIDDLSRNFAMNPGEGLKIRAYRTAGVNAEYQTTTRYKPDRQLYKLGAYLCRIATLDDFTTLDHRRWKETLGPDDV
ncbi:HAD-like domain-containing protein [Kockovaella imperatae]|uniref:protein-serine/threonine phosphatase n=1 Tax=Kockovaella imperatae TaxID=4999 RepID=A0A1Y1UPU5_9TREE|nr:HAD-like domain-containing protein [Kockovaella imperatae]ORX40043.1 HAD-like domain-containing protein [Kockovaella imperatae]